MIILCLFVSTAIAQPKPADESLLAGTEEFEAVTIKVDSAKESKREGENIEGVVDAIGSSFLFMGFGPRPMGVIEADMKARRLKTFELAKEIQALRKERDQIRSNQIKWNDPENSYLQQLTENKARLKKKEEELETEKRYLGYLNTERSIRNGLSNSKPQPTTAPATTTPSGMPTGTSLDLRGF